MQAFKSPTNLLILFATLMLGLSATFIAPLLSLFFIQELNVSALWVSFYFVSTTISSVIVSQWMAKHSDAGWRRDRIILSASLAAFISCFAFSYIKQFWLIWITGTSLMAIASSALPQLFAIAREQISEDQAALFLSVQRACISLAWIAGPPLAFLLSDQLGFRPLMLISAACYAVVFLCSFILPKSILLDEKKKNDPAKWDLTIILLSLSFICLFGASNLYTLSMPLLLVEQLGHEQWLPGVLMGIAAAIEIPVMIIAGLLVKRFSLQLQTVIAAGSGVIFYFGFYWSQTIAEMMLIQVFSSISVGVTAGIGISYFQKLMPNHVGTASAIYNNAIRIGMGFGALQVSLATIFGGYHANMLAAGILAGFGLILLLFIGQIKAITISSKEAVSPN